MRHRWAQSSSSGFVGGNPARILEVDSLVRQANRRLVDGDGVGVAAPHTRSPPQYVSYGACRYLDAFSFMLPEGDNLLFRGWGAHAFSLHQCGRLAGVIGMVNSSAVAEVWPWCVVTRCNSSSERASRLATWSWPI